MSLDVPDSSPGIDSNFLTERLALSSGADEYEPAAVTRVEQPAAVTRVEQPAAGGDTRVATAVSDAMPLLFNNEKMLDSEFSSLFSTHSRQPRVRDAETSSFNSMASSFGRRVPTFEQMRESGGAAPFFSPQPRDTTAGGELGTLIAQASSPFATQLERGRRKFGERAGRRIAGKIRDVLSGRGKGDEQGDRSERKGSRAEKIVFPDDDSFGLIRELHLPSGFKDAGKSTEFQRFYEQTGTDNSITYFNGHGLSEIEASSLNELLAENSGALDPMSEEFNRAALFIGGGYHKFFKEPQVSVETVAGRKVLALSDQDPETKMAGYTIFVPSEDLRSLYIVSYNGTIADLDGVKKYLQRTKWSTTAPEKSSDAIR